MKINGWDISEANAEQWNVTPGFHTISNDSEWSRGSPKPVMFKSDVGFKTLQISLLVKADQNRQAILHQCSEILAHLKEPAELELDDFDHKFFGTLKKYSFIENALGIPRVKYNSAGKLILEFDGYEYADEEVKIGSGTTEITLMNYGNILTPAIIEITPQIGMASITITGICRDLNTGEDLPVQINNLETGKTVILDGESGLFTQNGELKAGDIEIWEVPTLFPGENKITVSSDRMDIIVRYRPRFM